MTPTIIASILGAVLVVFGIGLVAVQAKQQPMSGVSRGVDISRKGLKLKTTYPGILIMGLGVFLLVIVLFKSN